jgi:Phospholipid-translocating P-type ATPase C-terminal
MPMLALTVWQPMSSCAHARTQAFLDAAIIFFIPFAAAAPMGADSVIDVYSVGRTINIAMLGVVTIEIMLVTRFWTYWFAGACVLSYLLVYPYAFLLPEIYSGIEYWDMAQSGVGQAIMASWWFWISLLTVYAMTFSIRYFERSVKWLFRPDDSMIIAELELLDAHGGAPSAGAGRASSSGSRSSLGATAARGVELTPLDGPAPGVAVRFWSGKVEHCHCMLRRARQRHACDSIWLRRDAPPRHTVLDLSDGLSRTCIVKGHPRVPSARWLRSAVHSVAMTPWKYLQLPPDGSLEEGDISPGADNGRGRHHWVKPEQMLVAYPGTSSGA